MARFTATAAFLAAAAAVSSLAVSVLAADFGVPPPPAPEPIDVIELPLPPVAPDNSTGACTEDINPRRTGCIVKIGGGSAENYAGVMGSGDFLPDSKHVISMVRFVGAPAAPDPASIYDGAHIILTKTDGNVFPNGDPWKCITCGIPESQQWGLTDDLSYPQSFDDNKRVLAGQNIFDCGEHDLTSPDCTPDKMHAYTIRWNTSPDGEGEPGPIRELRIHPDNVHLGFSAFHFSNGSMGQNAYFGRLEFNPSPTKGLPMGPRYDLHNVTILRPRDGLPPISVGAEGTELFVNYDAISVGELRGFAQRGDKAVYIGSNRESGNVDAYTVHLRTGKIHRLTSHPEYVDPIDASPDDEWYCILDTRSTTRNMFLAAMRGVPPITDMLTGFVSTGVRNNGPRRFFQPWLIDKYGDRDEYGYYGQKMNGAGNGIPGSGDIDDPEWNTLSDPRWSPDGTAVAYWQAFTIPPSCGDPNPLPCYNSTAQGGRTYRLMLARLSSRKPLELPPVQEVADDIVTWGIPYVPGAPNPPRYLPAVGEYTLHGKASGYANVSFSARDNEATFSTIKVVYHDYSDGEGLVLNGWENVTAENITPTLRRADWYSDLVQTGDGHLATKKTSLDGFHIQLDILRNFLDINGTLVTTINGVEYYPPQSGT